MTGTDNSQPDAQARNQAQNQGQNQTQADAGGTAPQAGTPAYIPPTGGTADDVAASEDSAATPRRPGAFEEPLSGFGASPGIATSGGAMTGGNS